ncbi:MULTISPECIES: hypothetical protein [unclassified Mesorhizobium]|uniref:hypothetical protein n=1 Tax=unclassified Mesorhizobium TaxID=325217 RepID=UPI000FD23857|nr:MULTISPECIES: hypothetical protein [unclassified Mesorhizobium]RVB80215.1 hypothetical protein EN885_03845 [Mesorhizobium sp. M6A.T.Cr.TU.014.01.1.1]RWQ08820.1 MAG: hypothetical protein EOR90_08375 [Mesorhizobium sp.]RWQ12441.1 MAG: hypothetical protein EOR91_00050 [Mesorhizobium sp.]
MATANHSPSTETLAQRAKQELREYALLSVYLFVCFGALILYKTAILGDEGISYLPSGLAAIKALILAKFMMLGHMIRLGDRRRSRVVYVIAYKALLYLILLLVLSVVEEVIVGRTSAASLAEFGGDKLPQTLATSLIMLLILIPYLASRELNVALGEGRLWTLVFEHRPAQATESKGVKP